MNSERNKLLKKNVNLNKWKMNYEHKYIELNLK